MSRPITYRPDIDGLRAVAVLGVILFHFWPGVLPGGFLGVDVFFVISGYLISKILLKSLDNNSFSIVSFYEKRIRRIFPALIIVCGLFLLWGYFIFFPSEFEHMAKHIASGASFIANIALKREGGYFDVDIVQKPFMHLWSLSVEEQFYVIWPLVLWGLHKYKKKNWLLGLTAVAICLSYGASILVSMKKPSSAFYLLQTRFWEIAMGSFAAQMEISSKERRFFAQGGIWECIKPFLGIALILFSFVFLSDENLYFSSLVMLPVWGAYLVVTARNSSLVSSFLALRPMVFIGLLSYPMYLFHWPLISFLHVVAPQLLTSTIKWGLFALTILLSYVTYRFVEQPIRKNSSKKAPIALVLCMVTLGAIAFLGMNAFYKPVSWQIPSAQFEEHAKKGWIHYLPETFEYKGFLFSRITGSTPETIAFFGDSRMEQYMPRIVEVAEGKDSHKTLMLAKYGVRCPIPNVRRKVKGTLDDAAEFVQAVEEYLLLPEITTVVLSASWVGYFNSLEQYYYVEGDAAYPVGSEEGTLRAFKSFENMVGKLVSKGKTVYIILPTPRGLNVDQYFTRNLLGIKRSDIKTERDKKGWLNYSKKAREGLLAIAEKIGAQIIDPTKHMCNETSCPTTLGNGQFMYKDAGHLSPAYVRDHVTFLDFLLE